MCLAAPLGRPRVGVQANPATAPAEPYPPFCPLQLFLTPAAKLANFQAEIAGQGRGQGSDLALRWPGPWIRTEWGRGDWGKGENFELKVRNWVRGSSFVTATHGSEGPESGEN